MIRKQGNAVLDARLRNRAELTYRERNKSTGFIYKPCKSTHNIFDWPLVTQPLLRYG